MENIYDVQITSIGNLAKAFLKNNSSMILLDEGIRPNLSDMVVEHTPADLSGTIETGDKLIIGSAKYTVMKVGSAVNENVREEGHCTIVFNGEGSMPGQIIVKGKTTLPVLSIGGRIAITKS